jgi:cytochrome P450
MNGVPMAEDVGQLRSVEELDIPLLNFADPQVAANPFAAARKLARQDWIVRTPFGYALLRYEDCDKAFRDRRFGVSEGLGLASQGITEGIAFDWANATLLALDGDEHRRIRMITQSAFTPKRAELLRGNAADLVARIYSPDVVSRGRAEVAELDDGYSVRVMCSLLGLPDGDYRQVASWAADVNQVISLSAREELPRIEKALRELNDYMAEQIQELRCSPGDSLGSAIVSAEAEGDRLSPEELVTLFEVLLLAGGDTTSNMLTLGLYLFAHRPEDWKALAADPSIAPSAVDEVLRYRAPFLGPSRIMREDVAINGVVLPKGAYVSLAMSVANFDPDAYPDADRLDIKRFAGPDVVPSHLSFGRGLHVCLGMHLAKVELQEAFRALPRLLPNLAIDDSAANPVTWKSPFGIHGPSALHLRWLTS